MKWRALSLWACVAAQGCFLASERFTPPEPADAGDLEARVRADSADVDAIARLSVLRMSEGRAEEARALLARAVELAPADPAIPLLLAVAQERTEAFTTASWTYDRYRRTRTGPLAVRAEQRITALRPAVTRARARELLAAPIVETGRLDERTVLVVPLARTGQDESSASEAAAVSALVARDLALDGWRVVDDALLRVMLDEMRVTPTALADLALGVELARRLGAGRVVQTTTRRVSLSTTEWAVTVTEVEGATGLRVHHLPIEGGAEATAAMQRRMADLVGKALRGEHTYEPTDQEATSNREALVRFGSGLRAMDRGDIAAASAAFDAAAASDPTLAEAAALGALMKTALEAPPLDSLMYEAARVGELQRTVLALRRAPGSVQQGALARVGEGERALVSDVLGLDDLSGSVLLDVTFTVPGGAP